MMTFHELVQKRRSVREFENRSVPRPVIEEMIHESCMAPSARNGQPWQFVVIDDGRLIQKLSDESKRNLIGELEDEPGSPLKAYEAYLKDERSHLFWNAPCLVYIGSSVKVASLSVDCALAAAYFMFSAAARGLGTCWVALGSRIRDPGIRREIGMPETFRIIAPVILGYPRRIPAPLPRREPDIIWAPPAV